MTKNELKEVVAGVLEADPAEITLDTDLRKMPNFDSVNVLALIVVLHEQTGIKLGPDAAGRLRYYREIEELAASQGVGLTD